MKGNNVKVTAFQDANLSICIVRPSAEDDLKNSYFALSGAFLLQIFLRNWKKLNECMQQFSSTFHGDPINIDLFLKLYC